MPAHLEREVSNEFSLDEEDMFEPGVAPHISAGKQGEASDEDDTPVAPHLQLRHRAASGGQSGSAQSSTLEVTLDDSLSQAEATDHHLCTPAVPMSFQPSTKVGQRQSTSSCYLHGTSVPVNIPYMMRGSRSNLELAGATTAGRFAFDPEEEEAEEDPDGFVPPHQLSQRNNVMFSLHGESTGTVVRRQRLKARDAILKSTGFVERSPLVTTNPLAVPLTMSHNRSTPRSSLDIRGGLSQALHNV